MKNSKIYDEDTRHFDDLRQRTVKCKCGKSVSFSRIKKVICSHCGNYVYFDKTEEFKEKLISKIRRKNE